jgi:prevent-host-death family protein
MAKRQQIAAGQFKAECLALIDRVAETGEALVITKHGRPVAKVVPLGEADASSLLGSVKVRGNIVDPVLGRWDVEG